VTQPALSRAIQQLEHEVGGPVFRRERNLSHLTELGLLIKPRLQRMMNGVIDVRREAKRFLTQEKADLSLGVMCTIGALRFTSILGHFQSQFAGINISLVEGTPLRLAQRLESGEIDVAIMAQPQGFLQSMDALPLYRERFLAALPAGHRLTAQPEIRMADLDGENYLNRLNCEFHNHIETVMRSNSCRVNTVHESEREDWIQNMVMGGLGVSTIPEFSAVMPGIELRPLVEPEIWRTVCQVTAAGCHHSPAAASFTNSLKTFSWPGSRFGPERAAA